MYVFLFLLTVFVLFAVAVYIGTKHRINNSKLSVSIIQLFVVAMIACMAYVVAIGSHEKQLVEHSYALYFASVDWILITFVFYARQYTKIWLDSYAAPLITTTIAVVDNISLFTNFKWHHAFFLQVKELNDGEWFYAFEINDYYLVHLIFCYILVALVVAILAKKTIMTSGFHRTRYLAILVMFLGLIGLNVLYLFFDYPVDVSMCFYALGAIFVGYYSLLYNPRNFVEYMLTTITERMECALVSFDENDMCIYSNQFANRMFSASGDKRIFEEHFKQWRAGRDTNNISNVNWNAVNVIDGEEYRFDIHFNKIYDKKGYFCGCYFSFYDVTGDFVAYEEEKYRNSHDNLTGSPNREFFFEEVRRILNENPTVEYVLACCDIKGFKLINEMFGEEEADKLLIRCAETIKEQMSDDSTYARLGGDRFAVLLPKNKYTEEIFMTGMNKVSNYLNNAQYRMVILTGVYDIIDRGVPVISMVDGCYLAIESIKGSFKNSIAYYGDMLRHEYLSEQKILAEFEEALQGGQFAMFLQPVMNSEGHPVIAEGLVRWIHPDRGIISPGSFIPLLEKTGYIYKLDSYIWEQAAKRLAYWSSIGFEDMSISVNISVKDFYYIDLYETLVGLTEKYHVNPSRLKLEITETVFMTEKERQLDIINSLKDYGFLIEIDDFGSGYSSLNMLKELPADILKMDMAFLSMDKNAGRGRKIVNTIISLAKALDMMVVIEGVETKEQMEYLSGTGADYMQGYFFDKPLPVKRFEEKYLQ